MSYKILIVTLQFTLWFAIWFTSPPSLASTAKSFPPQTKVYYLPLTVETAKQSLALSGVLRLPQSSSEKLPAVLILHGSAGVDSRGTFYAETLNAKGIATFEIDLWGGRGLAGGSKGRPALPTLTVPDALAALTLLAQRPEVDSKRIGVMGFSWGGVMTMLLKDNSLYAKYDKPYRFSAYAAHYPVCWAYNAVPGVNFEQLNDGNLLIQTGEFDDYDTPESCKKLVATLPVQMQSQIEIKVWPGVHHAWDRLAPTMVVDDPFSHLGKGGKVTIEADYDTAIKSREKAVDFFLLHL